MTSTSFTLGPLTLSGLSGHITATGEKVQVHSVFEDFADGRRTAAINSAVVLGPTLYLFSVDESNYVNEQISEDGLRVVYHFTRKGGDDKFAVLCEKV